MDTILTPRGTVAVINRRVKTCRHHPKVLTYRSPVDALVVKESFLQGQFLSSDLFSGHILPGWNTHSVKRQRLSIFFGAIQPQGRRLPWCPRAGRPPGVSLATSWGCPLACFPRGAWAPSPGRVSSPAATRSSWAACCCVAASTAAGPPLISSAWVLGKEGQRSLGVSPSFGACGLFLGGYLWGLCATWLARSSIAAPLDFQLCRCGKAGKKTIY